MSAAIVPVELPEPLLEDATKVARKNGMSVSSWISLTVAQQLRIERISDKYFQRRGTEEDARELLAILDKAPDLDPDSGDEF